MLSGKTILITGGTGSFGKKMVEVILARYRPEKLIIFSRDELKQYDMSQKWSAEKYPCMRYFLGDVRDKDRLVRAFHGVDYIIHAAALKQVPAAEYNPAEFIKTNVNGAMNVIDAAIDRNVKKVVALSTDKACNPANLYGATKLCSDKLFLAASVYGGQDGTVFSVVRYGNVVGSRGSVIPFFTKEAAKGVLPITDVRMTRFWITLDQAADFVLKALALSKGSEVFVPKIPSMKITDLAKAIAPECEHKIVGIRPGEKIHETLVAEDEGRNTVEYRECFVVRHNFLPGDQKNGKRCVEGFKYTSDNNTLHIGIEELRLVLARMSAEEGVAAGNHWRMEDLARG
ncbi:MAG: UDP-N-acetylglucosamine 4,6-dehydratase (inverting) [Deltaproteobacteria bacterium]|nr:UDP-N-acetylglucosamine 4,6-dehydratase (inverting) [Deltaproteobacteria bacterium]